MSDYRKQAKELAKPLVDCIEQVIIKQHQGILEEMRDQLKARDKKIERLKRTLGTAITWQQREFGEVGVKQLFDMLEGEDNEL